MLLIKRGRYLQRPWFVEGWDQTWALLPGSHSAPDSVEKLSQIQISRWGKQKGLQPVSPVCCRCSSGRWGDGVRAIPPELRHRILDFELKLAFKFDFKFYVKFDFNLILSYSKSRKSCDTEFSIENWKWRHVSMICHIGWISMLMLMFHNSTKCNP